MSFLIALVSFLSPLAASANAGSAANAHILQQQQQRHATTTLPQLSRKTQHEKEEQYEILPSSAILERLQKLVAEYPTFATLTTTQEWFGLPRAGGDADCPFDQNYKVHGKGCNNYVLIIQDKEAYPEDPNVQSLSNNDNYYNLDNGHFQQKEGPSGKKEKSGWKYIPDVFLSGSVHGNERVGPSSLLEMSELLVEAAYCESLPRMRYKPQTDASFYANGDEEEAANKRWEQELASAQTCRQSLASDKGIPSPYRQWLARLVSTRRTIVIPTANALGYSRNQREEDGIDPNRDFPFDIPSSKSGDCMQTIAGRSINELFRSHLFPIGLTFHGGMEVIGYEWGAPTYLNKDAPDAIAQNTIASAYSKYANGFHGHSAYDFGTMNDKVYYVRGGMEDWAFAGSWDPKRVVQCTPSTFGGYPAEKTQYNNSTLRAFNMLIETSDPKEPPRAELGKRTNPLMSSNGKENGHIARNMRLALLAMDVVEPYVSIREVEGLVLEDDVVPAMKYDGGSSFDNGKIVWVPGPHQGGDDGGRRRRMKDDDSSTSNLIKVSWTVGGAFNIDTTELVIGPWGTLPLNLADINDGAYPSAEMMDSINNKNSDEFTTMRPSNIDNKQGSVEGRSRWHADGPHPATTTTTSSNSGAFAMNPRFEATIDTSKYPPGTKLAIFAKATVDKDWLQPASNVGPSGLGPVSHIVNARQNPSYHASNAGKVIRGRVDDWWYSDPITIVIGTTNGFEEEEAQVLQEAALNNAPRSVSYNDDGEVLFINAVHINARLGYLPGVMENVSQTSNTGSSVTTTLGMPWLLGSLCIAIIVIFSLVAFVRRRRMRYAHGKQMARIAEDEDDSFSMGSYRDDAEVGLEVRSYHHDDNEDDF
eukprot:CAMPEP_0172329022 /NCGR_PEP_ID=MMETSP1058-20130122/60661_1 /TAXON_ID=83371 /ORGANISM="Detonula confervacea, Strain CCMP 353" /LENGTH=871 /DNA_ID=CAMNT_0013046167 /DNA_START=25 /DNA_END=2640 /DNA_ORIENTATION=-